MSSQLTDYAKRLLMAQHENEVTQKDLMRLRR